MALNAHLPDKETDASLLLSFSNAAHVSATFPFQELPTEVLTHVLGYVSFYDRMTLSTCSKTLLHNITEECTPLWSTISFHNDSKCRAQKSHITGEMVATLLNRVNPIKQTSADGQHQERAFVTRVLDIGDLLGVDTAVALEPLRHSNVLEQVRLKSLYDGGRSASSATVERTLEHLRTCIPFRLFKVDFDIPDASATTKELRDRFYRDLEAAQHTRERYRQVQEQRIPCSKCDDCVTEQGKQIVPSQYGMPSHRCFECCEYFCQKGAVLVLYRNAEFVEKLPVKSVLILHNGRVVNAKLLTVVNARKCLSARIARNTSAKTAEKSIAAVIAKNSSATTVSNDEGSRIDSPLVLVMGSLVVNVLW